jgi:hypothetical protein
MAVARFCFCKNNKRTIIIVSNMGSSIGGSLSANIVKNMTKTGQFPLRESIRLKQPL